MTQHIGAQAAADLLREWTVVEGRDAIHRTFLFRDFNSEPHYHAILRHVEVLARVDGLGVLRAKRQVDGTAVLHDLFDHYLNPD